VKLKFILMTLFLIGAIGLNANGLNLNGVGSKAIGMGGAFVGLADDLSAVFWNPAGLTQQQKPALYFFETNLIPSGSYQFNLYKIDAQTKSAIYPSAALAYIRPINEKLFLGFAFYVPAGTGSKWDGEELKNLTSGITYEWKSFLAIMTFSPVIAYQFSEKFSAGMTLNLNYGILNFKRPAYGQYEEKMNGFALGATFGLHYRPTDKLSFGFSLRTPSAVKFSGKSKMSYAPMIGLNSEVDSERKTTWPLWACFGIAFKPVEKLILTFDAQYTNWKQIDTIEIAYDDAKWQAMRQHQVFKQAFEQDFVLNWSDKIQWRFGAQYQVKDCVFLRAGYYYDPSPSPVETLNILLPEITYNAITLGVGYKKNRLNVDFCLEYLIGKKAESPLNGKMPGLHDMKIFVPNIAITFLL